MKKYLYLLVYACFTLLTNTDAHAQEALYRMELDTLSYQYKVIATSGHSSSQNRLRLATDGISINVTRNTARPHAAIDIKIQFSEDIDIHLVHAVTFDIFPDEHYPFKGIAHSWLTSNAIDLNTRTITHTMNGLLPGSSYQFRVIIWGLGGSPCGSDHVYTIPLSTALAPPHLKKKLLFVINQEWKDNEAIDQALSQYIQDVTLTDSSLTFDKYYIDTIPIAKATLFEFIQKEYIESNLSYLFFIGQNAALPYSIGLLNNNGEIITKYPGITFSYYTHSLYNSFRYNDNSNEFISVTYQDACHRPEIDIRNPILQQNNPNLSVGMLLPDPAYNSTTKTNAILKYFDKLHRYKHYEFNFDKSILLSDGFASEMEAIDLIHQHERWHAADTIKFGRIKDPYFAGYDPIWKEDYLHKIQNNSYEIFSYSAHGSSTYHSFGISGNDIDQMNALNTQIINFLSCEVGKFWDRGYLANKYLEAGNVLGVHAFSQVMGFWTTRGRNTVLANAFDPDGAFNLMAKGYTMSDAFRFSEGHNQAELILGDPLLKLRETCDTVVESQASGDWHARITWKCGRIPTKNDLVRILPGHTVTLQEVGAVKAISVEGYLHIEQTGHLEY
ncbi:hypothetical protein GCM10027275_47510 [Rhabdobacter roseus]|uniref:Gingipain domain-containing protein n=1 Tax=Rhabdobacter roseus TaxID=1655419 RepID=A0A840U1X4_9BACT|nr:C25 family cysteine peptidase [Rhabdobacter roseus]MBB5286368.1 hypothetical protein [Rhabdobacter roseus]